MKKIVVIYGENCAYCKKAKMLLKRAIEKDPGFSPIEIRYVKDISPEGRVYVHRYVPAFYVDGRHFFEGNPSMADIQRLLTACLENQTFSE